MSTSAAGAQRSSAQPAKLVLDLDDRDLARSVAGALQDLIEPPPQALTVFEAPPSGWRIEAYYDTTTGDAAPDGAHLGAAIGNIIGRAIPSFRLEDVPDLNWVTISQKALPPVGAGRFTVHGSHDRNRVPRGPNAILIDAGEAFGTAHHATTHGCLTAIDRLTRLEQQRPRAPAKPGSGHSGAGRAGKARRRVTAQPCRTPTGAGSAGKARGRGAGAGSAGKMQVLDLGCGSGVLAIAVARALPYARPIIATDLDPQSVVVARDNMRINGVGSRVRAYVAAGLDHPALRGKRFDLLIANILAEPLIRLAPELSRALAPRGRLVLSGLLVSQAREVAAAYRACGLCLVAHTRLAGWSTLVLRHRGK